MMITPNLHTAAPGFKGRWAFRTMAESTDAKRSLKGMKKRWEGPLQPGLPETYNVSATVREADMTDEEYYSGDFLGAQKRLDELNTKRLEYMGLEPVMSSTLIDKTALTPA